ncbi:hypothetical protein F5Y16DRAFT_371283 [Xylariaceae sp. FL0255]|nr:hypothetical protein F5Y16DRAFT_371283 [Xylariaceae sp. FL0255]
MPSRTKLPTLLLWPPRNKSSSTLPPTPTPSSSSAAAVQPPASPSRRKSSSSTSSSSTCATPISPPARLHLRSILPSSPEEPPIMPPPPRTPRAWLWQCHYCRQVYRLACTRRCLECSHTYCVSAEPPASQKREVSTNSRRGRKRRRDRGMCAGEFDFTGWEQWGSWRRKVLGYEKLGRCESAARDRAFLGKTHDCMIDCDSPSQCHHRRHEIAAEALASRPSLFPMPVQAVAAEEEEAPEASGGYDVPDDETIFPSSEPAAPVEELQPLNDDEAEDEDDDENRSPKSPLGQDDGFWNDDSKQRKSKRRRADQRVAEQRKLEQQSIANGSWAEESDARPVSRLTVRNLTEQDVMYD